jgi:hypothetical protein
MPVLLSTDADVDRRLDCDHVPLKDAAALMRPFDGALDVYAVAPLVNKVANDSADCIAPETHAPHLGASSPTSRKRAHADTESTRITDFFSPKRRTAEGTNVASPLPARAQPGLGDDGDWEGEPWPHADTDDLAGDADAAAWCERRHTLGAIDWRVLASRAHSLNVFTRMPDWKHHRGHGIRRSGGGRGARDRRRRRGACGQLARRQPVAIMRRADCVLVQMQCPGPEELSQVRGL